METTQTRRVGKHLFIFEKANGNASSEADGKNRTLIASCVNNYDEKLPREFVNYMRTLFDILDERRSGFVKLSDIEARWRRNNVNHLAEAQPSDVLENLRQVAPSNGLLSFEKLCLGFQLALRPAGGKKEEARKVQEPLNNYSRLEVGSEKSRSRGEDKLDSSKKGEEKTRKNELSLPLSKQHHRRPRSMVQLRQQKELDLSVAKRKGGILEGLQKTDKNTVINKLRQWQRDAMRKAAGNTSAVKEAERTELSKPSSKAAGDSDHRLHAKQHSTNQDPAACAAKFPSRVKVYYQGEKPNGLNGGSRDTTTCVVYKENVKTIISKEAKLKDLEDELKVLAEGLSTVEEVRGWLFTRITAIQEEKLYVKSVERYSSEDYDAMVHLMRRKELGMTSSSFKAFPKHMEELKSHFHQILQKPQDSSSHESSDLESKRKIAELEKEKSALIRELFQYKPTKEKPMVRVK